MLANVLQETIIDGLDAAYGEKDWASYNLISLSDQKGVHYQSNAAFKIAKEVKNSALTVALCIADQINKVHKDMVHASVSGQGFVNVSLDHKCLSYQMSKIAASKNNVGEFVSAWTKIVIDYSGPNIAKEMHVGHLRSTIIGDALSRIYEFIGHVVIRQNHVGDNGTQFGMLLAAIQDNGGNFECTLPWLEKTYKEAKERFDSDEFFANRARVIVAELQAGNPVWTAIWRAIVETTQKHIYEIYNKLGVDLKKDDEKGESFYNGELTDAVIGELNAAGLLERSDGATVVNIDSSDIPLIIKKRDGASNYATTDLAAIRYRILALKPANILYVTDSRQKQHFEHVFQVADKLLCLKDIGHFTSIPVLKHVSFGTILNKEGKPLKTREGTPFKLADLIKEAEIKALEVTLQKMEEHQSTSDPAALSKDIAIGAIKFADLLRDRETDYAFDLDHMLSFEGMTGPYVQYAYARLCSVLRKARATDALAATFLQFNGLKEPQEIDLMFSLTLFIAKINLAARENKPHHLTMYAYELAKKFTAFYENCQILKASTPEEKEARLSLCVLTAKIMSTNLDLLGIPHPQQM